MARLSWNLALIFACGTAFAGPAWADETDGKFTKDAWPLAAIERPLTLAPTMLELRGDTLGVNLSADLVGKPVFIAPDIYFGVNDKLTVGLTHQTGVCVTSDGCPKKYNDLGLEAIYGLMRAGSFQAAAHGGLLFSQFSPELIGGLDVGLTARIMAGKIALVFDPSLYVGALGRDEVAFVSIGPKETFRLPVDIQYQVNHQTMAFLSSGIAGPLDGFGDFYRVPVGLGALFAINNRIDFGGEIEFLDVAGPNGSGDFRAFYARLAIRI